MKGSVKATPKIETYVYYIFTENICSARNPMQVVVFRKHVLILYSNEVSIALYSIFSR